MKITDFEIKLETTLHNCGPKHIQLHFIVSTKQRQEFGGDIDIGGGSLRVIMNKL